MGKSCGKIVEPRRAIEYGHALAHELFLRIGSAELTELLAPQINLVAQINLGRTDGLTRVAKRAG